MIIIILQLSKVFSKLSTYYLLIVLKFALFWNLFCTRATFLSTIFSCRFLFDDLQRFTTLCYPLQIEVTYTCGLNLGDPKMTTNQCSSQRFPLRRHQIPLFSLSILDRVGIINAFLAVQTRFPATRRMSTTLHHSVANIVFERI